MKDVIILLMIAAAALVITGCTDTGQAEVPGSPVGNGITDDTTESCDSRYSEYVEPEPADTSIAVDEPLPDLKYSFGINDSGRTVTMTRGDTFEITLVYAPSLAFRWTLIVEPEGLVLLNAGEFTGISPDEESYMIRIKGPWNHRWRYLAEEEGTYLFDGVLAFDPCDVGDNPKKFNLTVVVE
jgi:predicted secreted protein